MDIQKLKIEQSRTRAKKQLLLAVLSMTVGNIKQACKRSKISRDTYYEWIKNPEFRVKVKEACAASIIFFVNKEDNGF